MGIKKTKFKIIPNTNDGNFNIEVPLKADSVYFNNNTIKARMTDSLQTLEETININEDPNTELDYSVSTSSLQTVEGGTDITVTVDVDNAVGGAPSRTVSLSTDGTGDVDIPASLNITGLTQSFTISATDDNLVENDEPYNVTLTESLGSFDLNSAGSYTSDSVIVPVTIIDNSDTPSYVLSSNVSNANEDGGSVTFSISSNVRDGRQVAFSITESAGVDNIDSVTGTNVTWDPSTNAGTFIPDSSDGSASMTVTLKSDNVYYNNNSFSLSVPGISKTINISEDPNTELNYSVSTSSLQTTEGGISITVTVDVDNMIGSSVSPIRTVSLSTDGADDVTLPISSELNITSPSQSFNISATQDSLVENDEPYNVTLTESLGSFDLNSTGIYTPDSVIIPITIIDDSDTPSYSLSSDVDSVDENGGIVTFSISSNVRDGRLVPFSITESLNVNNIDSITGDVNAGGTHFTPSSSDGSASIIVTMKTDSIYYNNNSFSLSIPGESKSININEDLNMELKYSVSTSSLQTTEGGTDITVTVDVDNAVGGAPSRTISLSTDGTGDVDIPASLNITGLTQSFTISATDDSLVENDEPYNVTLTESLGSFDLNSTGSYTPDSVTIHVTVLSDDSVPKYTLSSTANAINENEGEVTFNITSNLRDGRSVPFSITQNSSNGLSADNINSITGNINGSKTHFIPSSSDGSASITVTLKTDSVYYNNNSFNFIISESGSLFSEDGVNYSPNSISKSININEDPNTELDYSVSTSSLQTTEGGTDIITVTVDVDNVVGAVPSRAISLSTDGEYDVDIPASLNITGLTQSFVISAINDNLVENDEPHNITLTESLGSFDLNSTGSYTPDSVTIPVTVLEDSDTPSYSLSSDVESVNENGGQVVFSISSNVRKTVNPISFSITESAGVDNIDSVTGTNVTWDPSTNAGTFTPSEIDGSNSITVTLKSDNVYYINNSLSLLIPGESKSIDINEDSSTQLNYSVTTSSLVTEEGSSGINVTVDVDNVVGSSVFSIRTISLSTNGSEDVTIPSELNITSSSQSFDIIATDDTLIEDPESHIVTLSDVDGSFELNGSGSILSDSLDIPITINDNDVSASASYSIYSNKNSVNENGDTVIFTISSNVRTSVDPVPFSITENSSNGMSADNINSVTGTNVTWYPSTNTGTFIPDSSDGSASMTVTLKSDSVYYNNNSFSLSVPGDSKSININEQIKLKLSATLSPTTPLNAIEGDSLSLTINVDNMIGNLNTSNVRYPTVLVYKDTDLPAPYKLGDPFGNYITDQFTIPGISISSPTQTFNITVKDDSLPELAATYYIRLISGINEDVWYDESLGTWTEITTSGNYITSTDIGPIDVSANDFQISLSSDSDNVDEDSGQVKIYISTGEDTNNLDLPITISEAVTADNIDTVYSNDWQELERSYQISSQDTSKASGGHSSYFGGTYRLWSKDQNWVYAEGQISYPSSGTSQATTGSQINLLKVNIPFSEWGGRIGLSALKDGQVVATTAPYYPYYLHNSPFTPQLTLPQFTSNLSDFNEVLSEMHSSASPSLSLGGDVDWVGDSDPNHYNPYNNSITGYYSGYIYFQYLMDIDYNSTYSYRLHFSNDRATQHYIHVSSVELATIKESQYISVPRSNYKSYFIINTKSDGFYHNDNSFTVNVLGESISIDINEDSTVTELNYSVTTSSLVTEEGSSGINVTVDVDMSNVGGSTPPPRTISLSTNGSEDVTIPSELNITSSSQSFDIIATDDTLIEDPESYNVTLTEVTGSFELNGSGSILSDSLDIPITINDDDVSASYSISSFSIHNPYYYPSWAWSNFEAEQKVPESLGTVTFAIESNVRKSVDPVPFSITENSSNGMSADNIESVTGTDVTWDHLTNTGTFIPDSSDGSASVTVNTKGDDIYWNNNSFLFSVPGDSQSVNIKESSATNLNYLVTTDSLVTDEGNSGISVSVNVDMNYVVGTHIPTRTIDISTNGSEDITVPSGLNINSSLTSQSFNIIIEDDTLIENPESYIVTLGESAGSFELNGSGSLIEDSLDIPVTINDNDASPSYTISSSSSSVNEGENSVIFSISSNIGDSRTVPFTITETAGTDNISSVTGTDVTWDSSTGAGTFIPSSSNGSSEITINFQDDGIIYYGNEIIFSISESGSSFSLDGVNYISDSISETISINELGIGALDFDVTYSSENLIGASGQNIVTFNIVASGNITDPSSIFSRDLQISSSNNHNITIPSFVTISWQSAGSYYGGSFDVEYPLPDSNYYDYNDLVVSISDSNNSQSRFKFSSDSNYGGNSIDKTLSVSSSGVTPSISASISDSSISEDGGSSTLDISTNIGDQSEIYFEIPDDSLTSYVLNTYHDTVTDTYTQETITLPPTLSTSNGNWDNSTRIGSVNLDSSGNSSVPFTSLENNDQCYPTGTEFSFDVGLGVNKLHSVETSKIELVETNSRSYWNYSGGVYGISSSVNPQSFDYHYYNGAYWFATDDVNYPPNELTIRIFWQYGSSIDVAYCTPTGTVPYYGDSWSGFSNVGTPISTPITIWWDYLGSPAGWRQAGIGSMMRTLRVKPKNYDGWTTHFSMRDPFGNNVVNEIVIKMASKSNIPGLP